MDVLAPLIQLSEWKWLNGEWTRTYTVLYLKTTHEFGNCTDNNWCVSDQVEKEKEKKNMISKCVCQSVSKYKLVLSFTISALRKQTTNKYNRHYLSWAAIIEIILDSKNQHIKCRFCNHDLQALAGYWARPEGC